MLGQPKSLSIDQLFSRSRRLIIPKFQRRYSWKKPHVDTFWTDLLECSQNAQRRRGYFIGPMVVFEHSNDKWEILDGQQRLATIQIVLSLMRDILAEQNSAPGKQLAWDIQRMIEPKDNEYSLHLNDADNSFFRRNIQQRSPQPKKSPTPSHRLILNAKSRLRSNLLDYVQSGSDKQAVGRMKHLFETLKENFKTVIIPILDRDDAYQIFETLNDRGQKLAIPDLLLNFLMYKADEQDREKVKDDWDTVIEKIDTQDAGTFLRDAWVSRNGDIKKNLFKEIRDIYKEHPKGSLGIVSDLDEDAEIYKSIWKCDRYVLGTAYNDVFALTRRLSIPSSLPVLLAGRRELGTAHFQKLASLCVRFAVRYFIATNHASGDIEDAFYAAAEIIAHKDNDSMALERVQKHFSKLDPDDDSVKKDCGRLELSKGEAQYIVGCLANRSIGRSKEIGTNEVDLEHIFPQNAKKDQWPNLEEMKEFIMHLGNLTVMDKNLNQINGNRKFSEKVKNYRKSKVKLTKKIASYSEWNPENVADRAYQMGTMVANVWPRIK